MRPNADELIKGIQRSLMSYVMPEVHSDHVRAEMMFSNLMLGVITRDLDGAVESLVEDNASLRDVARGGASALMAAGLEQDLAAELERLAGTSDPSLRLSDLSRANEELAQAIARLAVAAEERDELSSLRATLLGQLRARSERMTHSMLGPRADG
jgi:hypothetical protein